MNGFTALACAFILVVGCEATTSPAAQGDIWTGSTTDATVGKGDGVPNNTDGSEGTDGSLTNDGVDASDGTDPTDVTDGTDASDGTDPNAHTTILICRGPPKTKGWCHLSEDGLMWLCCDVNGVPDFSVGADDIGVECEIVAE